MATYKISDILLKLAEMIEDDHTFVEVNEAQGKEMRKNVDLKKEVFGNERNDSRFKRR